MAVKIPAVLFGGRKREKTVTSPEFSLSFDLQTTETHKMSNKLSAHPVENGTPISDHIENELRTGQASYFMSNYSLRQDGLDTNRTQEIFDLLEQLWESKSLVTLVTDLKVYEDVAISSIDIVRNETTGEAGLFAISFREFRTVSLQRVTIEANITIVESLADPVPTETQAPAEVEAEQERVSQDRQSSPPADAGVQTPPYAGPYSPGQFQQQPRITPYVKRGDTLFGGRTTTGIPGL